MDLSTTIKKRASEFVFLYVDFAAWLQAGESITGSPVIVVETGSGLTADNASVSGTKVQARFSGGTPNVRPYEVTVKVTVTGATASQTYTEAVYLRVLDN
jgi:hypothetical protein